MRRLPNIQRTTESVTTPRVPSGAALAVLLSLAASCRNSDAKSIPESAATRHGSVAASESRNAGSAPRLAQSCDATPGVLCYQDTARPGDADEDPMLSPLGTWIWFAAAGDSLEISAIPSAAIATSLGQERDSLQNTAPRFRHRVQHDGVVILWLAFDEQVADSVRYTLRVKHDLATASELRPTGQTATLTVMSRGKNDTFSLVPKSVVPHVRDRSWWRMFAKVYKVALVSDSLYELCRLPCSAPRTVLLKPSANVIIRF